MQIGRIIVGCYSEDNRLWLQWMKSLKSYIIEYGTNYKSGLLIHYLGNYSNTLNISQENLNFGMFLLIKI